MQTIRWLPLLCALFLTPLPQQAMANTLNLSLTGVASQGFQDALFDPSMSSPTVSFAGQPITIQLAIADPAGVPRLDAFTVRWSNQSFSLPVLTGFSGSGAPGQFQSPVILNDTFGAIDITPSPTYTDITGADFDLDLTYATSTPHSLSAPFTDSVTGSGSLQGFVPFPNNPTFGSFDNRVTGDFILTSLTASVVPEPTAWAVMLAGLFTLGVALRARRRATAAAA